MFFCDRVGIAFDVFDCRRSFCGLHLLQNSKFVDAAENEPKEVYLRFIKGKAGNRRKRGYIGGM